MMLEILTSMLLLVLGIAVLVTIHVCIVKRAFGRSTVSLDGTTRIGNSTTTVMHHRNLSMSQDDIKKLPCFDYKLEESRDDDDQEETAAKREIKIAIADCVVCLENFKQGEKCRLLPNCRHSFHAHCIDVWLLKNGACPICRAMADSPRGSSDHRGEFSNEDIGM